MGTLAIVGISLCYSACVWVFMSAQSPVYRWVQGRRINRVVRREATDLDRRLAEFTEHHGV